MVVGAGCLISLIGFGARSSFGLFLEPMTVAHAWPRETFALAMAFQNLLWGLGLPIAGAIADRRGAVGVIAVGTMLYAGGTLAMASAESGTALLIAGGVVVGLGMAFSSFSLALAAMARVVGPERRSFALGVGTAAGSLGQVVFSPVVQGFIVNYGWSLALTLLATMIMAMLPLAFVLPGNPTADQNDGGDFGLTAALTEALNHRGYLLLTSGFFVCGFHVAFVVVHFPAYVRDLGFDATVGAYAIAILGLFNIVGAFLSGVAGQRYSKRLSLCWIYAGRALVITWFLTAPMSASTVYLFSAAMGVLWLSTVPLTTGIVAQVFGPRYMATLFGVVFLGHQLGSFTGVWLGGRIHDLTGSYELMWQLAVALSVFATLIHWPIDEKPLVRRSQTV